MLSLISNIFNFIITFLMNANSSTLLGIIVTGTISYGTAKFTSTRPQKIKIKQLQLSNVYLPLHRLLEDMAPTPTVRQALEYHRKISNILNQNYELAFPQLHKLNKNLQQNLLDSQDYAETLRVMKYQIDLDYELLKKSLGYPSKTFRALFVRMTFSQKLKFILPWIDALWLLIPGLIWFLTCPFDSGHPLVEIMYLIALVAVFSQLIGSLLRAIHGIDN